MLDTDRAESVELAAEGGSAALSRETIFELLSASRRREVLRYLDDNDGKADIGTLAEHVAGRELDAPRATVDAAQRKRVYVGLYQFHLPKLTSHDMVSFDEDTGEVELLDPARVLLPYLRIDPSRGVGAFDARLGPIETTWRYLRRTVGR